MERRVQAALYSRPSAVAVPSGDQLRQLRRVASEHGWLVVVEGVDRSADPKAGRPEIQKLLAHVRRGAVDVVLVARLHLLARSVGGLVEVLDELHARGIDVVTLDGFDSTTGAANPLDVVAMLRRAEREFARERGHASILAARRRGPIGRPRVEIDVERAIALRAAGKSIRRIALTMGSSATSVHRALRAAERDATSLRDEPREAA